ncbi:hypothetical protein [Methanobrevibacter sp.]|uniref:hypothetical protein n=1 Tax=Methanobrevibacter sp. TaxID=66852 RepID=UPI0038907731
MYGEIVDNSLPDKWDAEDKIFNLCMVEIEEFPQYLTKLDDIEGVFHQRYLSKAYKDLNLDSVREKSNKSLINIEHHSSINRSLLSRDFEYQTALHAGSKREVQSYIFNTGSVPNLKIEYANPTSFFNPIWINTQDMTASISLNNIKYKLLNSEVINVYDVLDLMWMPKFRMDISIEEMIAEIAGIYNELIISKKLSHVLRRSLILWAGKFVADREKLDKIKGDLKMSAMEINSLEEDIKSARIAGALMRSEEKGRKEGIEKGIKEGKESAEKGFVLKLLKFMSPEEISVKLEIPLDRVYEIKNL